MLQEDMEMLLRKASRQALALLEKLDGVLGPLVVGPHLGSCITHLMCPQACSILQQLSGCLTAIPILLTRTLAQGSETEFYFEVSSPLLRCCRPLNARSRSDNDPLLKVMLTSFGHSGPHKLSSLLESQISKAYAVDIASVS